MGAVYIDQSHGDGHKVCHHHGVPSLDFVVREGEIRLAEDKIGADEIVGGSHGKNSFLIVR